MSDAPSKAARELAEKLAKEIYGPYMATVNEEHREMAVSPIAALIQSALENLLEKADTLYCRFGGYAPSHGCSCNNCELAKAIKPWKAGE